MSPPDYSTLGYKSIIVTLDKSVAILLINRPKQRNSFTSEITDELVSAFELFDKDDRVHAVIVTADPTAPAYCSGADISGGWNAVWDPSLDNEGDRAQRDPGGLVALAIYRCRKITIAAVNGHAVGVGMTAMQLPFDFRFAWSGAKLAFPFVRRGVSPESGATYLLPRLLGHSRATALILSGATLSPDSPLLQGLYHSTFPTREEVFPAALAFARELAENTSQLSVAYAKGLLQHPGDSLEENHVFDSYALRALTMGPDGEEGARAFKERRNVRFTGKLSEHSSMLYPWWPTYDTRHRKAKL